MYIVYTNLIIHYFFKQMEGWINEYVHYKANATVSTVLKLVLLLFVHVFFCQTWLPNTSVFS